MTGNESSRDEIRRLLALFRRGLITEDDLLEQLDDAQEPHVEEPSKAESEAEQRIEELLSLLDGYRAAEASGAATLRKWSDLCEDAGLAGGLRTIAARESFHAELLERRIRELGGEPHARVPAWLTDYNEAITDPRATDEERLGTIVAQFPNIDAALEPLEKTVESLVEDPLTRELLRTIGQDERASLEWLHATYATRSLRG